MNSGQLNPELKAKNALNDKLTRFLLAYIVGRHNASVGEDSLGYVDRVSDAVDMRIRTRSFDPLDTIKVSGYDGHVKGWTNEKLVATIRSSLGNVGDDKFEETYLVLLKSKYMDKYDRDSFLKKFINVYFAKSSKQEKAEREAWYLSNLNAFDSLESGIVFLVTFVDGEPRVVTKVREIESYSRFNILSSMSVESAMTRVYDDEKKKLRYWIDGTLLFLTIFPKDWGLYWPGPTPAPLTKIFSIRSKINGGRSYYAAMSKQTFVSMFNTHLESMKLDASIFDHNLEKNQELFQILQAEFLDSSIENLPDSFGAVHMFIVGHKYGSVFKEIGDDNAFSSVVHLNTFAFTPKEYIGLEQPIESVGVYLRKNFKTKADKEKIRTLSRLVVKNKDEAIQALRNNRTLMTFDKMSNVKYVTKQGVAHAIVVGGENLRRAYSSGNDSVATLIKQSLAAEKFHDKIQQELEEWINKRDDDFKEIVEIMLPQVISKILPRPSSFRVEKGKSVTVFVRGKKTYDKDLYINIIQQKGKNERARLTKIGVIFHGIVQAVAAGAQLIYNIAKVDKVSYTVNKNPTEPEDYVTKAGMTYKQVRGIVEKQLSEKKSNADFILRNALIYKPRKQERKEAKSAYKAAVSKWVNEKKEPLMLHYNARLLKSDPSIQKRLEEAVENDTVDVFLTEEKWLLLEPDVATSKELERSLANALNLKDSPKTDLMKMKEIIEKLRAIDIMQPKLFTKMTMKDGYAFIESN